MIKRGSLIDMILRFSFLDFCFFWVLRRTVYISTLLVGRHLLCFSFIYHSKLWIWKLLKNFKMQEMFKTQDADEYKEMGKKIL